MERVVSTSVVLSNAQSNGHSFVSRLPGGLFMCWMRLSSLCSSYHLGFLQTRIVPGLLKQETKNVGWTVGGVGLGVRGCHSLILYLSLHLHVSSKSMPHAMSLHSHIFHIKVTYARRIKVSKTSPIRNLPRLQSASRAKLCQNKFLVQHLV
jgi:hypothetical protein